HLLEDLAVAVKRRVVPLALSRLDAAPLDGHAMRIVVERRHALDIPLRLAAPPARRLPGDVIIEHAPVALLLPVPPVVVLVVALDLVRGCRRAPQEVRREGVGCLSHSDARLSCAGQYTGVVSPQMAQITQIIDPRMSRMTRIIFIISSFVQFVSFVDSLLIL